MNEGYGASLKAFLKNDDAAGTSKRCPNEKGLAVFSDSQPCWLLTALLRSACAFFGAVA
jgi:hypothetical protein